MKQLFLSAGLGLILFSCNDIKGKETKNDPPLAETRIDITSLNKEFNAAWNAKDSVKVVSLLADDVKLLKVKDVLTGKTEVAAKWLNKNLPVAGNLKTNVVSSEADNHTGYEAGTFALDVSLPNQKPFEATGNYTFIWKRQSDNSWKINFIQLEDHDPAAPAKNNN
jgi:ketosteroid isomerase-like protein